MAAGAARAAAAVVGNVVTTPDGRQAGVGQSCRAPSTAIGVARLWPGLLAFDRGGPLGPLGALGPWGLHHGLQEAGVLQGAGTHRQRLRLRGGGSHLQLLPQVRPQVSPGDADMGVRVLDDHLMGVHGLAWQGWQRRQCWLSGGEWLQPKTVPTQESQLRRQHSVPGLCQCARVWGQAECEGQ